MRLDGKWFRAEVLPFVVLILLLTAARSSLADHYYVPTGSMEYTLMPGDRVVVDKTAYGLRVPYTKVDVLPRRDPVRGEIALFDSPRDGTLLIKRIVAIGGDVVELADGRLSINGIPLAGDGSSAEELFEERTATLNLADGGGPAILPVTVPRGQLLVLGDHRGDSLDGRYFGFIDEHELYGRAIAIYYRRGEGFVWKKL